MAQTAGAARFVYNLALEQRRDFWRQAKAAGVRLCHPQQTRELTILRQEVDWLGAVHVTALQQALLDLDRAYAKFFSRLSGYPTFRTAARNASFRHVAREVSVRQVSGRWAMIRVPKLGWVKMRITRPIAGRVLSVTFLRDALGWHAAIASEIDHDTAPSALPRVGLDRGVANTVALSTGELLSTSDTARLERRKKRAQRILTRRRRGSNRYRKQRQRLSRITAKIARVRADWRHKATSDIARRFGLVAMEDLNTAGMTRAGPGKRGLNRSIIEQGWGAFATVLSYKLEERGGALVKVNPAYTSQECSACGTIDKASRESQSSFACRHCGFAAHADTNAALNILRRSTASMRAEDAGCGACETRTDNHALAA